MPHPEIAKILFEDESEYFDFKKSPLAEAYLKSKEYTMVREPKYIPEPVLQVWRKVWNLIQAHRPTFEVALLTLYNHQTDDEQEEMHTVYKNYAGFNKSEGQYLSKMMLLSETKPLSLNEVATCVPLLRKYVVQLILNMEFMETVDLGFEFRSMVLPYADEIQEIRRRG